MKISNPATSLHAFYMTSTHKFKKNRKTNLWCWHKVS